MYTIHTLNVLSTFDLNVFSYNLQLLQTLCHNSAIFIDIMFEELGGWDMNLGTG